MNQKFRPAYNDQSNHGNTKYPTPSNLPYRPSFPPSPPRIAGDHTAMPLSSPSHNTDLDMDMDEDFDDVRSQPPDSPALGSFGNLYMRPAMLQTSLLGPDTTNTGRLPTPIRPTFRRSGMSGLGYPLSGSAGGIGTNCGNYGPPTSDARPPPVWNLKRQDGELERNHRMPSPISEDEDIPDTPTALTQSQLSRLSFSHGSSADQMETETSGPTLSLPPTQRGRKRSGAFTGMGRFSMGYRDDCEKCRQRVPGHYSHFVT